MEGNYTIANSLDIPPLVPYTCILGNLRISAHALSSLDLPNLRYISGILSIESTSLPNLDGFSALKYVGGSLEIRQNDLLTDLDGMADLESVEFLLVYGHMALKSVNLPSLATVTNTFAVHWDGSDRWQSILIIANPELETLDFSSLATLDSAAGILDNTVLPYCEICADVAGFVDLADCDGNLEDACWSVDQISCP
ncbi:MAG: hypothetical protein GY854_32365 [Deltaproteobacteria bacterium]|nr:hypothetical protein [Deltaproteobacteria bacterium]